MNANAISAFPVSHEWKETWGTRRNCIDIRYFEGENPIDDYPRCVEYKGLTYARAGYNSDTFTIHYKEATLSFRSGKAFN